MSNSMFTEVKEYLRSGRILETITQTALALSAIALLKSFFIPAQFGITVVGAVLAWSVLAVLMVFRKDKHDITQILNKKRLVDSFVILSFVTVVSDMVRGNGFLHVVLDLAILGLGVALYMLVVSKQKGSGRHTAHAA